MPHSDALMPPAASHFGALFRLSVLRSAFIVALLTTWLLSSLETQANECPSSIHFYRSIGA